MSANRDRSARLVEAFADHAERCLVRRLDLDRAVAAEIGRQIAEAVRADFAGQQIYIPTTGPELSDRDRAIVEACASGRDIGQVATEHGIAMQTAYKIIRSYDRAQAARAQPDLFPTDGDPAA